MCFSVCGGCGETQKVRLAVVATTAAEAAAAAAAVVVVVVSTSSFKTFELEVLISCMKWDCLGITLFFFSPLCVTITVVWLTGDDKRWQLALAHLIHDISAKFCLHQWHWAQTGLLHESYYLGGFYRIEGWSMSREPLQHQRNPARGWWDF